ncbi:MAG: ABC transporter ATP-binding protein [Chloroflexota bacterium]
MTPVLQVRGLTRRFGSATAVAGIDLDVAQGEIFGLVGPNGAGKTTTLRMLATLLPPSGGDARVMGHSIRREPDAVRQLIGWMPDSFGVYDDMRVWEYLDFFARCHGIPAARRKRLIDDLLELVDLGPKRDAYVEALSRGMQQRLCLAHALVHEPPLLLLDEPASGLDPRARVELRELLRELRAMGRTIVVSSHILPELEELCTAVAIIDHGRVLASGRVDEIQGRFRQGSVARVSILGGEEATVAAAAWFTGQPEAAGVELLPDGRIELALRGDAEAAAALLARAVGGGLRVAAFAPAASDLEELFLQITAGEAHEGGEAGVAA